MADKTTPGVEAREVRVEVDITETAREPIYANYVKVEFTPHEFVITFARILPENVSAEKAVAKAEARIIVPHHLMPSVIGALSDNLAKYQAVKSKLGTAEPSSKGE